MDVGSQLLGKRYELLETLGKGGMGVVYRALDRLTGQIVALKRVTMLADSPDLDSKSSAREFRLAMAREFKALATLRHPHVIHVLDYGFDEAGFPFFTMELLAAPRDFLAAAHHDTPDKQLDLLVRLLQALAYLHRRNILHRDLKPANVLVDAAGNLKVLDFGLATRTEEAADIEELAGTLNYMAPELFEGQPVSRASDLYAFGIMAYELMTGFHPFEEYLDDAAALVNAMLRVDVPLSPLMIWEQIVQLDSPTVPTGSAGDSSTPPRQQPETRVWSNDTAVIPPEVLPPPETKASMDMPETREHIDVPGMETKAAIDLPETAGAEVTQERPAIAGRDRLTGSVALVMGRLLEKSPQYRYQDAYEVITDMMNAVNRPVPQESAAIRESFLQAAMFVGRQAELNRLTAALQTILSGKPESGSAWLIGGESGVGKTRLLDELRTFALVQGVTVLHGQAVAEGGVPYQMWREPLRRLLLSAEIDDLDAGILQDIVPDVEQLLQRTIPRAPEVEDTAYRQRLTGVITSLFQHQTQPMLLLLEDLQWTAHSLDVLQVMTGIVSGLPLMIVAAYRPDERADLPELLAGMQTLRLERLDDSQIVELTVSMLGEAGKHSDVQELLRRETEGNVYFLVEVVRALAEEAGSLTDVGRTSLPKTVLSGGIARLVERRLSRVPEADRALLRIAAVAGREIELNILLAVINEGLYEPVRETLLDNWLTTCANLGVLEVHDGKWRFSHDRLRQGMLKALDADTVPLLHQAVARAIEMTYPGAIDLYATLMRHWQHAGDAGKEQHYARLAGDYALQGGSFAESIRCFTRALELLTVDVPEGADIRQPESTLRLRRAEAYENQGDYPEAIDDLERGLTLSRAVNNRASIAYGLSIYGDVAWRQSEYARAIELCQESVDISEERGDMRGMARALNRLGVVAVEQGEYATAAEHLLESLDLARKSGYESILASVANNLGLIAFAQGNYDEAAGYFKETLEIARQGGERRKIAMSLLNLGVIAGETQKNYPAAMQYLQDAHDMFQEIGERRGVGLALSNLGGIAEYQKQYELALSYYERSLTMYRSLGERQSIAQTLSKVANVMHLEGMAALALERYMEALRLAHEIDATPIILETIGGMAGSLPDKIQALNWFGLVMNHPAMPDNIRSDLTPSLEAVKAAVSPEAAEAALNAGKALDLKTIVVDILNRFPTLTPS